jgi:hypothetical protein
MPKGEKHAFMARKPLDLLTDDLAIQAFTLEHLLCVWTGPQTVERAVPPAREAHENPDEVSGSEFDPDSEVSPTSDPTGAYFLLPLVAMSLAIRNTGLAGAARLDLIQLAFFVFFGYLKHYPNNTKFFGIAETGEGGFARKTLWTRAMCRGACNTCIGLYWAITKYGGRPDFELTLNRIGSHSVECHFGMTRSILRGVPRWERFLDAQVKAVMLRNTMQQLRFPPYIRRFAMPADCIVPPDTEKSIQIDFGNMIDVVNEMTHWLSVNNSQQALDTALPLIGKLFNLHRALILGEFHQSSHGAGAWSGGAIQARWSRPKG